ncbi:MAG: integrase, partial [Thermodesulfobacteriota bacterium]
LDWQEYYDWLSTNKSKHYARFLRRESKKQFRLAFSNELARLPNDRKREDILKALTNLIRYIDIKYDTSFHEEFLHWIKRKEIKWKATRPIVIPKEISLHTIVSNLQKLEEKYRIFGIFALVSGLRTFEIVKVLNNHDQLCHDGIIEMYWDRKTKKSNAVFCHPLLHDKIKHTYTENTVHRHINSKNLGCETKYLRKINFTINAMKIDPLLAEFMQGRRGNVSQRHYFLPMMNEHKKKWIKVWEKILNLL